jgi:hypothetical protein
MAPSGARATYSTVDGSKFLLMNATAETSSMTWVINGIAAATRVVR